MEQLVYGTAGLLVVLIAWAAAARVLAQSLILPGPLETVESVAQEVYSGAFLRDLGATFLRSVLGFSTALIAGLAWGLIAGLSARGRALLMPALVLIRSTPVIAVILLAIIWFSPDAAPVLVTWLMVTPVVVGVVESGIRQTERSLLEMARVFRVPAGRVVREIHLPTIAPLVRASAHSGLGMAYKVTVAAEVLVQPPWSIGGAMQEARFYLDTPRLLALTLIVVVLGGLTEGVLRLVDRAVEAPKRKSRGVRGRSGSRVSDRSAGPAVPEVSLSGVGVRVDHVSKCYGQAPVIHDVSLSVPPGQVTVLLGPSGCGKTTLLRIICGLETADEGSIVVPPGSVATMVFQEPRVLNWRTAGENIEFVLPRDDAGEYREAVSRWLARVGLESSGHMTPRQMSGGMVQRLALARAFAVPSATILMDEPFQNLDLAATVRLCATTRRLHRERGGATLFVTHDVVEAVLVADRIVLLSDRPARVTASLPNRLAEDVRDPRHREVVLTVSRLYDALLSSNQQ